MGRRALFDQLLGLGDERLARLAEGVRPARAADWLTRIEELRGQLAVNVNRRVATDALFLSMASD